jgi:peptidoglycan/xylan/chitin deacetylase (PgdA/CDA1 family)
MLKSFLYSARRALVPWRNRHRALVLCYHSVRPDVTDPFSISPETFERHCEMIRADGFTVVPLSALEDMLKEGIPPRTLAITLDDGRLDNYTFAFPILQRFGYPATIFSITDVIGKEIETSSGNVPALNAEQMREMQSSGLVDFEPHTARHVSLTTVPLAEAREQVVRSRKALEEIFAKPCPYFAYPHGKVSPEVERLLPDCGIRLAFSQGNGFVRRGSDPLTLPRNDIVRAIGDPDFKGILAHGRIR